MEFKEEALSAQMKRKAEMVEELRRIDPYLTGGQIARLVGRSREYVRKTLRKAGLRTTSISYGQVKGSLKCQNCGKQLAYGSKRLLCRSCYLKELRQVHAVRLTCATCGNVFSRRRSKVIGNRTGLFFCRVDCRNQSFDLLARAKQKKEVEQDRINQLLKAGINRETIKEVLE